MIDYFLRPVGWSLPVHTHLCSFLIVIVIVRLVLLVFGLNVIGSLVRISRRVFVRVEDSSTGLGSGAPLQTGPKYLIKDEVIYRPEPKLLVRSQSIISGPAGFARSLSRADLGGGPSAGLPGNLAVPGGLARSTAPTSGIATAFRILTSPPPPSNTTWHHHAVGTPLGTPLTAVDVSRRLPGWTDKLISSLTSAPVETKTVEKVESNVLGGQTATEPVVAKVVLERRLLTAEDSLAFIGLGLCLEELTENLRRWLARKVIGPLAADINEVAQAFSKQGLDHLNPYHPASFSSSIFGPAQAAPIMKSLISISPTSTTQQQQQPQSLMDLAQSMSNDPLVQKRLRLEKYLAFANLATRRSFVVGRILAMAKGNLLAAFSPAIGLDSDTEILLSLFSTFMDENMPSSDYYDAQPFSGKHLVRIGEKPSLRPDAIQIAQTASQSFQLVADDLILASHPGPNCLFHAIIFLVEYVHRHREGFLGIANLSSRAIDLTSIFK